MARPLLTFYGDDFTGSSAVMEVLSFAGVPTMLFLSPPSPEMLAAYPTLRAFGIAGIARSRGPGWMEAHLPPIFEAMRIAGAPVSHYKVCSTFDSSPAIGSVGKAAELGAPVLGGVWHPLVVGAPALGRYQAFGNLFAAYGDRAYRLDRHPVMSRHPVTPMTEADLALHLSHQTDMPVGLIGLDAIKAGRADAALARELEAGNRIIALDIIDEETLAEVGRLIWQDGGGRVFAIGSQGVEYALVAHWRATGLLPARSDVPLARPADRIFGISGSCSPVTADQITVAEARGFKIIALEAALAADPRALNRAVTETTAAALAALEDGKDTLVVTARGPDDPAMGRFANAVATSGTTAGTVNDRIGTALGRIALGVRRTSGISRIAVSGGDTSGQVLISLGADALSAVAPLATGAPLCRVHALTQGIDGLEITLKGGQMGSPDFFLHVKEGRA